MVLKPGAVVEVEEGVGAEVEVRVGPVAGAAVVREARAGHGKYPRL